MKKDDSLYLNTFTGFFERASRQAQFYPTHLSLLIAIVHCCSIQNPALPFNVTRKKLMRFSRIRSISTYHKNIQDLIRYGFIRYSSSSHPKLGSEVKLIIGVEMN
jgi:hypothetical protein